MDLHREIVSSFFEEYQNVPDIQNSQNVLNVPNEQVEQVEEDVPIPISKTAAGYNHLIMRRIATYLSITDLKVLRLVSRHWNNNFSDAYFEATKVSLKSLGELAEYTATIDSFVHSKFDLKIHFWTEFATVNFVIFQQFFEKYGHQIQKLKFSIDIETTGIEDLQGKMGLLRTLKNVKELDIAFNFWGYLPPVPFAIPVLPSLQTLTIKIEHYTDEEDDMFQMLAPNDDFQLAPNDDDDGDHDMIPIVPIPAPIIEWNDIAESLVNVVLTMAPNLKSLKALEMILAGRDFRQDFYRIFAQNVDLMPPPFLQELFIYPTEASFEFLLELPYNLKKLGISLNNMEIFVYDELYEFLQCYKNTLKFLSLDVHVFRLPAQVKRIPVRLPDKFPQLENLKLRFNDGFYLDDQEWENVQFQMPPIMNYSEMFPKLKTLSVSIAPCEFPEEYGKIVHPVLFPEGGLVCNSVQKIELQFPSSYWMAVMLRVNLTRMFPNADILSLEYEEL